MISMFQRLRPETMPTPLAPRLCLALLLFLTPGLVSAQTGTSRDFTANKLSMSAAIVLGVINYTRWPQPSPSIRVCLLGTSGHFSSIRQLSLLSQETVGRPTIFSTPENDATLAKQCDLVYVGATPESEVKTLIRNIVDTPILTIGEGKEFCSLGGMFCIDAQPGAGGAGFSTNLDAISRSKLRVNPQVLRLSSRLNAVLP
jgi:hypothetical protein